MSPSLEGLIVFLDNLWKRQITLSKAGSSAQGEDAGGHEEKRGLFVQTRSLPSGRIAQHCSRRSGKQGLSKSKGIIPPSF